jgi:hypothetical protein
LSPEAIRSGNRTLKTGNVLFEKRAVELGIQPSERTESNFYEGYESLYPCNIGTRAALWIPPNVLDWLSNDLANSQFYSSAPANDSNLNALKSWNDELIRSGGDDPRTLELRDAKVQAFRATIAHIRGVSITLDSC